MVCSQRRVTLTPKVKGKGKSETHMDLIRELEKRSQTCKQVVHLSSPWLLNSCQ